MEVGRVYRGCRDRRGRGRYGCRGGRQEGIAGHPERELFERVGQDPGRVERQVELAGLSRDRGMSSARRISVGLYHDCVDADTRSTMERIEH